MIRAMMGMSSSGGLNIGKLMMMLRLARLARILRLARLIKNIPQLYFLVRGITQAMRGMMWVLVLTTVFLYACSLVVVKLLRDGIVYGGTAPLEVQESFPTVPDSFFAMFNIMNGVTDSLTAVFATLPIMKWIFMAFTVLSSWAMLSILTAVVSENMITATENGMAEEEALAEKERLTRRTKLMHEIFDQMDQDRTGTISEEEFQELLKNEELMGVLHKATGKDAQDLQDLFESTTRGSVVDRNTFINHVQTANEGVTRRSIMALEKSIAVLQEEVRGVQTEMTDLTSLLKVVVGAKDAP